MLRNHVVDGDSVALARVLDRLAARNLVLIGYNSSGYDIPMLRAILGGRDAYETSRLLIERERQPHGERRPIDLRDCPRLTVDHVDVAARLRKGGRFPSLKTVAANLGRPRLRELPYAPDADLTDAQWLEVKRYNAIDLSHTWAVLEVFAPELEALASLSTEHGIDLRSTSNAQVVERIFVAAYRDAHGGQEPPRADLPLEVGYRPPAGVLRPRTPAASEWFDRLTGTTHRVTWDGDKPTIDLPTPRFTVGGLTVRVGKGGLHSVDPKAIVRATSEWDLWSADVASYYPTLIDRKRIFPRAYGPLGGDLYHSILDRRLTLKAAAKVAPTEADRHRLEVAQHGLKIVLNSTFGKFGSRHSSLFDLEAMLGVTLSGQLMLIDLIERLEDAAVEVVSANTDGLFFRTRRGDERWRPVLVAWERDTEMSLEVEGLDRLLLLGTNCYATRDTTGKIKRRGAALKGNLDPEKASNSPVVADAVAAALLEDTPPEVTIGEETRPERFCSVTRTSNKVGQAVLIDDAAGTEDPTPKITRWYKTKGSTLRLLHRMVSGKETTPAKATGIRLAMDLSDADIPRDLDTAYYIAEACKVINSVPGDHHLDPALLPDRGLAREVFGRGLSPFPKRGKDLPLGAVVAAPTWLWDWPRYPTCGTLTGPRVGILVVDVDVPPLFKKAVDKNDMPLLAPRWRDLEGCLISCRGEATPEGVRQGLGRGKLIFRHEAAEDHFLAHLKIDRWKAKYGLEVFYGKGIPSVLGVGPDGTEYRLDGVLGPAPGWLLELLRPPRGPTPRPRRPGRPAPATASDDAPMASDDARAASDDRSAGDDLGGLDDLRALIADVEPKMGEGVAWRPKDLGDRVILVGRCPFAHDSGTSSDGDLSAGLASDGVPWLACKHASCVRVPEVAVRLDAAWRRRWGLAAAEAARAQAGPLDLTPIARYYDLAVGRGARGFLSAATGSGKTYAMAQVATARFRRGEATCIALPTNKLCAEVVAILEGIAPDAVLADAIARVYDRSAGADRGPSRVRDDEADLVDFATGRYPIHEATRVIVTTHANLMRRGASRSVPGFWTAVEPSPDEGRPPVAFLIDELGELIRHCGFNIPLDHRVRRKHRPDRRGGRLEPVTECPMRLGMNGSCANCRLRGLGFGAVLDYNGHNIKEFQPAPVIHTDAQGDPDRDPIDPLVIDPGDFQLGLPEPRRVAETTFANSVVAYRGQPLDASTHRTAPVYIHRATPEGGDHDESPQEILAHYLSFAFEPTWIEEHPVGPDGITTPESLCARREQDGRKWPEDIVWPRSACQVPRIVAVDLYGLEAIRRYAERHRQGVVFADGTATENDLRPVLEVFPDLEREDFPDVPRKIDQVAVVGVEGYHSVHALATPERRLVFEPLAAIGKGLVFLPLEKQARRLFETLRNQPGGESLRLATDGAIEGHWTTSLTAGDAGIVLAAARGFLGRGANLLDLRFVVVDANVHRHVSGFNTATITPEEFARLRAEECMSTLRQNLGRALRGEPGKQVVIFVLGADDALVRYLATLPAIVRGSERPPVFVRRNALGHAVSEAKIWLENKGGEWPTIPPQATLRRRRGRPARDGDSKAQTRAKIVAAAHTESRDGRTWREFVHRHQPARSNLFEAQELEGLRGLFRAPLP
ncbi:MAG: hypothetical protein JO284_09765 [Planctomycetaceae bacterium]|nr:hypothetical protein [Planctomycetaceae bacterium]